MTSPNTSSLPRHIALIPDGNRRWAKRHGVGVQAGHKAGYDALKRTAYAAFARGVPYVTAYAFSTENWNRTQEEIGYLMKLMAWVVKEESRGYHADNIRIRILGFRERLDPTLAKGLERIQELTRDNTGGTISLCVNYGGRADLLEAVRKMMRGGVVPEDVTEPTFAAALSSAGLPDPDLVVRTSGEQRMSNYLLWESAYSELYFTDVLWPDFNEPDLDRALAEYAKRQRNFGK